MSLGALMLYGGLSVLVRARRFRARAVRVRGRVVDLRRRRSDEGKGPWADYAVLRFVTKRGQEAEQEAYLSPTRRPPEVGQVLDVLYDPADVSAVQLADRPSGALLGAGSAVLGVGLLLPGLLELVL